MTPEEVVITAPRTGTTRKAVEADCAATRAELARVFPFISELAELYKACEEGPEKDAYLADLNALDAKRCELDDHLAAQLPRLRTEF